VRLNESAVGEGRVEKGRWGLNDSEKAHSGVEKGRWGLNDSEKAHGGVGLTIRNPRWLVGSPSTAL